MKRITLLFIALTILACSSAEAGSCVVPKFLKKGAQYEVMETTVTIVEIDKKSCWIKVKEMGGTWLNLNALVSLTPQNE